MKRSARKAKQRRAVWYSALVDALESKGGLVSMTAILKHLYPERLICRDASWRSRWAIVRRRADKTDVEVKQ